MEAIVKTKAVGGSLMVTIPKDIVNDETIKEGEIIKIHIEKIKKDWFGCLKGIGSFTKEDEMKSHD